MRYLLEEGKLNMCLRSLVSFVEVKKELRTRPDTLQVRGVEMVSGRLRDCVCVYVSGCAY